MMKLMSLSAVVMVYIGGLSAAKAQELPLGDEIWIGAALGTGFLSESVSSDTILGTKEEINTNGFSGKIDMGYNFNQYIGVYGSYDHAQHTWSRHDLHLASFGLKGKEYLTDRLSLFGKAGATYLFKGDNDNGLIGSFGLGLEYQLTNAVAVRFGADYYNDLDITPTRMGDLTQLYWGMTYRFGQPATPLVMTKTVELMKEVQPVKEDIAISFASTKILFSNNSSLLMSTKPLEGPLDLLNKDSKLKARIVGHADSTGSADYNQRLSLRRAKTVAEYFISNDVDPSRISALGRGEDDPIANNNSEFGRSQNRRVELTIE
ncbi:OmpA family protein [Vibrio scophthalmi]|uniref:Outer membrane protein n=1 Tax=Vibrio scophthalmi TaxID=45658 RepID=A0A1E3WIE8_9VIBR|nr:OmpA family protein [Vibrio scophthalmi]ODS05584.1 Outer membrane protein [Vibrio scophthalmi]